MKLAPYALGILLLGISCQGFAQQQTIQVQKYMVEHGLPENTILSLIQDARGYVWIGTQNGLVRYDGQQLKPYPLPKTGKSAIARQSIRAIHEDNDKRIWLGTLQQGLYVFDRASDQFKSFRLEKGDTGAIRETMINAIGSLDNGHLLLFLIHLAKQEVMIQEIDPDQKIAYTLARSPYTFNSMQSPLTFAITLDQKVWLSRDSLIHQLDDQTKKLKPFTVFQPGNGLGLSDIAGDTKDSSMLWISTYRAATGQRTDTLYTLDLKTRKLQMVQPGWTTPSPFPRRFDFAFSDSSKQVWFTGNTGLSRYDYGQRRFQHFPVPPEQLPGPMTIATLTVAPAGDFWFSSSTALYHFDPKTGVYERFIPNPSDPTALPTANLSRILVDKGGTLWLGSNTSGLFRKDPTASLFRFISRESGAARGFRGRSVTLAKHLNQEDFWLNSSEGLFLWKPSADTFIAMKKPAPAVSPGFSELYATDREGNLWGAAVGGGLLQYQPATGKWRSYRQDLLNPNSIPSNNLSAGYIDKDGLIWLGSRDSGLCHLDPRTGQVKRFPFRLNLDGTRSKNGELDDAMVLSIFQDSKGDMWIGTNIGGLNRLDKSTGRFTSYVDPDNDFQTIVSIFEDSKNRLWAGTYIGGLFLLDRSTGKHNRFTEANGMLYNGVNEIFEDRQGNLWLTSFRGLTRLEPDRQKFTRYTSANGLPENILGGTVLQGKDERFYLTSRNGLIIFDPNRITRDTIPPIVAIHSFAYRPRNSGQTRDTIIYDTDTTERSLAHNENRIQFQFGPLHFNNMAFNECSYMLEGYDKDWIPAKGQRSVVYTNLSPGHYRFLVKAINGDGVESRTPAVLAFEILPPWWMTWWALIGYLLALALGIRGYILWRSRALREEKRILEETVATRTRDLEESLQELRATQDQLVQSEKMASLGELTAGIAHEIQNPLNFVNNFAELNEELLTESVDLIKAQDLDEAQSLLLDIKENTAKIKLHGKRADVIVKSMLQHSRSGSGEKEPTDINALVDEYLRLSYHGYRAKDKAFNALIETEFDPQVGSIQASPQDLGRVLLNLFNNACYALAKKTAAQGNAYEPRLRVSTKREGGKVVIRVRDNGTGIPESIVDKIYHPFFTTKPTGEGTGLGLSLSYEMITRGHGGTMDVDTEEGAYTEFIIRLPG